MLARPVVVVGLHSRSHLSDTSVKSPGSEVLADLMDNQLRRRVQPPDLLAGRHGVHAGMTVLDVGPGNGRYSVSAARPIVGSAAG